MNNIAISNHLLVNLLQTQNVKREIVKKKDIQETVMIDENKINDSTGTGSGIDIGTINTPSQQTNTL
jgi:hypothetical protein